LNQPAAEPYILVSSITRKYAMLRILYTALLCSLPALATAEDFHSFDPAAFDGLMLPPAMLQAMTAAAIANTPPKNDKRLVMGFANLQRDISFAIKVEESIERNAEAAGVELLIADNRLDGPTALANAESFARRRIDFAIEFQTDVNFGPPIMRHFVASVAYFPERYGNYLVPLCLMRLAGRDAPPAMAVEHAMITPANICEYYPAHPCRGEPDIDYAFPQQAFVAHLQGLADRPELDDYRQLIPAR